MSTGKTLIIKLIAIGHLNDATRKRDVFFLLNGEARVVAVTDEKKDDSSSVKTNVKTRDKALSGDKKMVGAPMAGLVVEVRVKKGSIVKVGDPICVLSAMSKKNYNIIFIFIFL